MFSEAAGMQVDLSIVLGAIATAVSSGLGVMLTLVKMNVDAKDKETDRRITEVRSKVESVDTRLHIEEKATIRQDGDLQLVKQTHTTLSADVQEIKSTMATKDEVRHVGRAVDRIAEKLDASSRRYTPGPGAYGATEPPKRTGG